MTRSPFPACTLILAVAISQFAFTPARAASTTSVIDKQPPVIKQILDSEKSVEHMKRIVGMLEYLDEVYTELPDRIAKGMEIIVFVDPAHGMLENGKWEGEVTDRLSSTGKPEEHYSIMLSRCLYRLLAANKHIEIKSTPDFLKVMRGESDIYKNIPFSETVKLARENKAFILVSEHLNNVSILNKAGGLSNMPGIHVTYTRSGKKYLISIRNIYKGFLTLYNKFDVTGISKLYATNLRQQLVADGLHPNNWDLGSVADDRFTYFVDFPISVIYESGFISNPEDEKNLSTPAFQERIAKAQYDTLLKTIKESFGVDISGSAPVITKAQLPITLMKLAHIAIYYLKNGEPEKTVQTIATMQRSYASARTWEALKPYAKIKTNLSQAMRLQAQAVRLLKGPAKSKKIAARRHAQARHCYNRAMRLIGKRSLYAPLREQYATEYKKMTGQRLVVANATPPAQKIQPIEKITFATTTRAGLTVPIILPIDQGDTLESALVKALAPDAATLKKLVHSFRNACEYRKVRVSSYSKKKKKKVWSWKNIRRSIAFDSGIYVVRLNRSLQVQTAHWTSRVPLVPSQYQNQQYLKNSYFAIGEKTKSL